MGRTGKKNTDTIVKATFTVKELAEYLGIGRQAAYRLVKNRIIPSVRIGNLIRIPVVAVDRWLEEATQPQIGA